MRPILIYRIGFLGDTLVSLPAVYEIRRSYPDIPLYLLTTHSNPASSTSVKNIMGRCVGLSGVIEYNPNTGYRGLTKLIGEVKKYKFSALYYLAPLRKSWMQIVRDYLFFRILCGISASYGFARGLERIKPGLSAQKESDRLLGIVTDKPTHYTIPITDIITTFEQERVSAIVASLGREVGDQLIAFCPGSKMPAKRWPVKRFLELGSRIIKMKRTRIVILGDEHDAEIAATLQREWGGNCINCAGTTTVFESAAILSECDLYIGNDTGAMHLAAAVGVPCLAIFSARDVPGKWEPMGENNSILRADIDCIGCMQEICTRGNACMNAISVDQVMAEYRNILDSVACSR